MTTTRSVVTFPLFPGARWVRDEAASVRNEVPTFTNVRAYPRVDYRPAPLSKGRNDG